MRKIFFKLLLLGLLAPLSGFSQDIALEEKLPKLRLEEWLEDSKMQPHEMYYLDFFSCDSPYCRMALLQLRELSEQYGEHLGIILLTKDAPEKVKQMLSPYLSEHLAVLLDKDKKGFETYGVKYVPFGVLIDSKRRVKWMGNTLKFNSEIIEKSK